MKLSASILCFDCGRCTARVAEEVTRTDPKRNNGEPFCVGWRCIKCTRKKLAGGSHLPIEHRVKGQGWRRRFDDFMTSVRKFTQPQHPKSEVQRHGVEIRTTQHRGS